MSIANEMNMINPYLISTYDNRRIRLNSEKFIIGRSPHCSYVLDDYGISKTHCIFEKINGVWYLTNQSSNGISLNRIQIPSRTACTVSDGDRIKFPNGSNYVFVNKTKDDSNNLMNLSASVSADISIQTSMRMHAYCKRNPAGDMDMNSRPYMNTRKRSLRYASSNVPNNPDSRHLDMPSTSGTNNNSELPTKKRKLQSNKEVVENVDEHLQCIICTELFINASTLGCSHTFCSYCIEVWRKRNGNCPVCRAEVTQITLDTKLDDEIANVMKNSNVQVRTEREEIVITRKFREDTFNVLGRTEDESHAISRYQHNLHLALDSSSNSSNSSYSSSNSSHNSSNSSYNSTNSSYNSTNSSYNSTNSSYSSSNNSHSSHSSDDSLLSMDSRLRRLEDILFFDSLDNLDAADDFRMLFFATSLL